MRKLTVLVVVVLLVAMGQALAGKPGGKPPGGNGGSDKGGFGELGDGCLTFYNPPNNPVQGTIHDDSADSGKHIYCNGTDGQVSVPVRLRFDTKKFNADDRYFSIWGSCSENTEKELCISGVKGRFLQMGNEAESLTGLIIGGGLDWTLMKKGAVTRVGMGVSIDNKHHLSFNKDGACDDDSVPGHPPTGPVYVRCDGNINDTGPNSDELCDQWTVSTDPSAVGLVPSNTAPYETATACFKTGVYGDFLDHEVIANFTWKVCVMGLGISGCPPAP